MTDVSFFCNDVEHTVVAVRGRERLGEVSAFEIDIVCDDRLDGVSLLGGPGTLVLNGSHSSRAVGGVIASVRSTATADDNAQRRYRISLRSSLHLLTLRQRTEVFQKLSAPDIIKQVFKKAKLDDALATSLMHKHTKQEYVTQYAESDATFIRRMCETYGLYFHFELRDGVDTLVLCDDSTEAAPALSDTVKLADVANVQWDAPAAFECSTRRARCAGKVTLRDYDPEKPDNEIEGKCDHGVALEKGTEIYRAPVGVKTKKEAGDLAKVWLESERAEALTYSFRSTAVELAPGTRLKVEPGPDYTGTSRPKGDMVIVACEHDWTSESGAPAPRVTVIPKATRFRLERVTPKPRIAGLHSAFVTGGSGEEISTDDLGHVTVRFHWDRIGPKDDKSSKPIRVMQPNLSDSMLIPRVGWEVLCAFEDGDPDRPYVLGRTYNAKQMPPHGLPANKTITSLATLSSPGGGAMNSVFMDDAAGRQHMVWNAGLHKTTKVANNKLSQTVGFSAKSVKGSQTRDVGGNENISVKNAFIVKVGSQSATVNASQTLQVNAAKNKKVSSESVLVGGALTEQVGNPADGLKGFAEAAVLAGVEMIPVVGEALSMGWSAGKGIYEGYKAGGWDGAMNAAGQQAAGIVAGKIPGGDAILAGADATGITPWSDKAQAAKAAAAASGGTGGAGAKGAAAAAAAPGHKKTIVDGVVAEGIGALCSVTTPGSIKCTTLGAAQFAVAGGHTTRAVQVSMLTGGVSSDTLASISIDATKAHIGRTIKGALKTDISGGLTSKAGGVHHVKASGNMTIDVSGSVVADGGAVVFMVGSSTIVAAHGGGLLLKASKVIVNGKAKQSGKATNS